MNGAGNPFGRALALYRGRVEHDAHVRRAPFERAEDVAQRRRLRAGDDADAAREQGQGTLALLVEQALRAQLLLQAQEGFVQGPHAGAADRLDVDLVIAARAVQGHQGAHLDLVAFARNEAGVLGAAAEHHGAHLGGVVLEREIPVARTGAGEVRYLAADPGQRKGALQQARHLGIERANGQHRRRARRRARRGSEQGILVEIGVHGKSSGITVHKILERSCLCHISRRTTRLFSKSMILNEKALVLVFLAMAEIPSESSTLAVRAGVAHKVIHRNCVEVFLYLHIDSCLLLAHRLAISL